MKDKPTISAEIHILDDMSTRVKIDVGDSPDKVYLATIFFVKTMLTILTQHETNPEKKAALCMDRLNSLYKYSFAEYLRSIFSDMRVEEANQFIKGFFGTYTRQKEDEEWKAIFTDALTQTKQ